MEHSALHIGHVVLVNEFDTEVGTMDKLRAHQEGVLHRAFSIFLFDEADRLLLQCRASGKYHSAGLWTNSCCSHPRPGETTVDAAIRRLQEELGIADVALQHAFTFVYRADVGEGLVEHELDHVLFGRYAGPVHPDAQEVSDIRWVELEELSLGLLEHPERYTAWLSICWPQVLQHHQRFREA